MKAQSSAYPVSWMCQKLEVSTSGYYMWRRNEGSAKKKEDLELISHIRAAHSASKKSYGSPRIYRELRSQGLTAGRHRVAHIMRENGICCPKRRSFVKTTNSAHGSPVAPNLLLRDFRADAPNKKWVTDITYISTADGWVYLAAITDLFSRRIVGWALADNMEVGLTLTALNGAIKCRNPPAGLIHHSDRGSQYASKAYQNVLNENGILCSMSGRGECWDNAVAESFFGRLKEELIHKTKWESRAHVMAEVENYIDGFYNSTRRHSTLDYLSPLEYELAAARCMLAG